MPLFCFPSLNSIAPFGLKLEAGFCKPSIHLAMTLIESFWNKYNISSVHLNDSVVSNSLWPQESQHTRPPCPSPTPGVHPDASIKSLMPSSHLILCLTLLLLSPVPPSIKVFPMSQLFTWGGQSTGASALASFLPKNTQGWFPSEWNGWISLHSKGLSRVFSNTTLQKHQFFGAQLSS